MLIDIEFIKFIAVSVFTGLAIAGLVLAVAILSAFSSKRKACREYRRMRQPGK